VVVSYKIKAFVFMLQVQVLAHGAEIVAYVQLATGLNA